MVTTIWWSFFHIFLYWKCHLGLKKSGKTTAAPLVPLVPRDLFSATTPRQRLPATIAASPPLADLLHELGHVLVRAVPSAELKKSEKVLIYKIWRSCRFGSFNLQYQIKKTPPKRTFKTCLGQLQTAWHVLKNGSFLGQWIHATAQNRHKNSGPWFLTFPWAPTLRILASCGIACWKPLYWKNMDFSLAFDSVVPSFAITLLQHAGPANIGRMRTWGCGNINLSF